jgi:AcrR family transcriptional regulator
VADIVRPIREPGQESSNRPVVARNRDDPPDLTDRRSAILDGALELFALNGYRATTMADLGERAGIRGPSIYKWFSSKQEILAEVMLTTMRRLVNLQTLAITQSTDPADQLKRAMEIHVRYHARNRREAFVGTREIQSLQEPTRSEVLELRDAYERGFRDVIERGRVEGLFTVHSSRLASYAILDMGMGVAVWFREEGPVDEDTLVRQYGRMVLRMVGLLESA